MFQTHRLKLEMKCNFKKVDYLDITFDLKTGHTGRIKNQTMTQDL